MKYAIRCIALLLSLMLLTGCAANSKHKETKPMTPDIYQTEDPSKDDRLNLLMIGSSFCYYYVEELYGMLEAAGIKANICNVYYSGCPLEKHYNWWKSGEAHYDYFITNENGRVKTAGVNLEWCLQQQNWDIISLQESTSRIFNNGAAIHFELSRVWRTELWDYLKQQFPMSRYLWHQPWTYQIGTATNGYVMESFEQQENNTQEIKKYAISVCEELQLERVNTGEAWQIIRGEYGYDKLCARIGKGENNEGDYYHDGDIGGGQYLNACVWFEVITGQSCIGNPYRPLYNNSPALSPTEEQIQMFQAGAHKAVEQMKTQ